MKLTEDPTTSWIGVAWGVGPEVMVKFNAPRVLRAVDQCRGLWPEHDRPVIGECPEDGELTLIDLDRRAALRWSALSPSRPRWMSRG